MKNDSYRKTIVFGIICLFVGMGFIPSIIGNKDVVNVGYNRIGTAHMGIIPSSDTVNIGEDFIATIYIDPSEAVGGWEIYLLIFTQGIVNATEVSPGPEWTDYFDDGNIHNDTGNITFIQTLKFEDYPDYNHTACIINFTALHPGVCSIELVRVEITDIDFYKMNVTVHNTTVVVSSNQPPYTPSGPYPEDGATGVSTDADLSWIGGDPDPGDTVTYDVYFGTTSPPPKIVSNQSGTTIDPGILDYCTTYYWKIIAWDNHGAYTEGPIWSFTTNCLPYEPSNPNPEDGETGVDVDHNLSWDGGDPDPGDTVTYDVYFGASSPPQCVVNNQSDTSYDPGTMNPNTQYYWQIIAWDNHGASTSGPIWEFTTENNPPNAPSNPDPSDGATDVDMDADLSWICSDPDGDSLTYDVYFEADDSTPDVLVSDDQTDTTFDPGTLDYETTYYWQIIAEDEHGASTEGPIWSFTTEEEPEPDLDCEGSLSWTDVEPGATVTGSFTVSNIGDPGSLLDWEVIEWPDWGSGSSWTFTPSSGNDLTPKDGPQTVQVEVVAPDEEKTEFEGEIKIVNSEDSDDYCIIPVSLITPVSQNAVNSQIFFQFFQRFIERFPLLEQILELHPYFNRI